MGIIFPTSTLKVPILPSNEGCSMFAFFPITTPFDTISPSKVKSFGEAPNPNPAPNPPPRARVGMRRPRIVRPSPLRGLKDQIAMLSAAQTAIAGQRRPVQDRPVPNRPAQNLPPPNPPPPNPLRPKSPDRAGQSRQAARARAKGGPVRGEETRRFPAWETGTVAGLCL